MIHLEVGGRRFPIGAEETVLGSGPGCDVPLEGEGIEPRHAIVQRLPDGSVAVRRVSPTADLRVNGIRQGDEPTPVLHGDRIHVGTYELRVVDSARAGSTQLFDSSVFEQTLPAASPPPPSGPAAGGRLVCLTDGREYRVGLRPLVFGRDAASDVVVPGHDVSRRHAEIVQTDQGYVIIDHSTNGTFVNGQRIEGTQVLRRADVIRIGVDEFRFYADPVDVPAPRASRGRGEGPPPGAEHRLFDTMYGLPAAAGAPAAGPRFGPPLASLLVRSGALKGKRLAVRETVATIGRAQDQDLVIPDASVSASHAKLERREGIWLLSDLGSTNGTFADGERVTEETALGPGATLRFGEVTALFESADDATAERRIVTAEAVRDAEPGRTAEGRPRPATRPPARSRSAAPASPRPLLLWALVAALAAAAGVIVYTLLNP